MMKSYPIITFLHIFVFILNSKAQKICQDCWDNNEFKCNGLNCQAFYKNPNDTSCTSSSKVKCADTMLSICYIPSKTVQNLCVACNFTYPGCLSCNYQNAPGCYACKEGYYLYKDLSAGYQICKTCSCNIAGCQLCKQQGQCRQCQADYRTMNGLCYNQDGTIVNGSGGQSGYNIFTIILLFVIIVLNGAILFFIRKISTKSQGSLLSQSNQP